MSKGERTNKTHFVDDEAEDPEDSSGSDSDGSGGDEMKDFIKGSDESGKPAASRPARTSTH